ncbi:hypothetical protein TRFO_38083 [Tritrichomonas foetus]|uniref:DUF3447 domain-containing protein n=1 Tax=Tritrichomonas foetus TaxID=1144522 RepID=A0A1J4JC07_9EUKA|nr:hypothetical protein TRFO_38083 [Tritrichomonas foetus]|eukprot:OHS95783.1 hypothetical protein TRFO_38083 [Tritrichomonas foetus]
MLFYHVYIYGGLSPVHYCGISHCKEIVDLLLNVKNLNLDQKSPLGITALDYSLLDGSIMNFDKIFAKTNKPLRELNCNGNCYLSCAIQLKYYDFVKHLIEDLHFDPNEKGDLETSTFPLSQAIMMRYYEMIVYLINLPNINFQIYRKIKLNNVIDSIPLVFETIMTKDKTIYELLLNTKHIDLAARDSFNNTCLHFMMKTYPDYYNFNTFALIFDNYGYDVNSQDSNGDTLLHLAATVNNGHLMKQLMNLIIQSSKAVDVSIKNKKGQTIIETIIDNYLLIRNKNSFNPNILIELTDSLSELTLGNIAMLIGFFPKIFIPEKLQNTDILLWAIKNNNVEAVIALLKLGFDLNTIFSDGVPFFIDRSVVSYAAENKNDKILRALLSTRLVFPFNDDDYGNYPIHYAVRKKEYSTCLRLLIIFPGVDLNVQNKRKNTPLIEAIECRNINGVEILLSTKKVDVNIANIDGETAIFVAVRKRCKDCIQLLLKSKKINFNNLTKKGENLLHYAVNTGDTNIIEMILKIKYIDVNLMSNVGTPLYYAIRCMNIDIVNFLLEKIPNIDVNYVCKIFK